MYTLLPRYTKHGTPVSHKHFCKSTSGSECIKWSGFPPVLQHLTCFEDPKPLAIFHIIGQSAIRPILINISLYIFNHSILPEVGLDS